MSGVVREYRVVDDITTNTNHDYNEKKKIRKELKEKKDRIVVLRQILNWIIVKKTNVFKLGVPNWDLANFWKLVPLCHTSCTTDISIWKQCPQTRIRDVR